MIKTIKGRRSIRKYQKKDISEKEINNLMEAIRWSPSWTNSQCWEVVIIRDQNIKKNLQMTLPMNGNPSKEAIVQAPVLLAMCSKIKISGCYNKVYATKFGDWFMYDLGIATQSLCLMAHYMGLGTVVVGLFDHEKAAKIIEIPKNYEIITLIPVGYPSKIGKPPSRKKLSEFTHYNFFNK